MVKTSEMISLEDVNRCSKLIGIISDVPDGAKEAIIGQTTAYAMGMKAGFQLLPKQTALSQDGENGNGE